MARRELSVTPREVLGKKVAQLRRAGKLPGNIYGHGIDSVSIQIEMEHLIATLRSSTANEVIDVKVAGEAVVRPVVLHHIQRHPLTSSPLHADFYQVSLRERMRADVPIVITGRSDAVDTYNGVQISGIEVLHVDALPLDIPTHIEVDISVLTELEATIFVRDLTLPGNVTILNDPDVMVVKIASPRVEAEDETPEGAAASTEAGGEGEPSAEGEEGATAEKSE